MATSHTLTDLVKYLNQEISTLRTIAETAANHSDDMASALESCADRMEDIADAVCNTGIEIAKGGVL